MSITTTPYLDGVWQPDMASLGLTYVPAVDATADIAWSLNEFRARLPRYALYHAYLAGEHRLTFVTKGYRAAFQNLLAGLRCNLCPRVVHALTDRLRLTGFEQHDTEAGTASAGERATPATQTDAQRAWALWQDARLDRHFNQVKQESVGAGDAYMLVWPDPDDATRPRFYPQRATDMVARYDRERTDTITLAAKLWREGKRYRLNLYYDDRIEKYRASRDGDDLPEKASAFERYQEEGEAWPLRYEQVGVPVGRVPVFHFAFNAGIGQCGLAELKDIIPIQDALNKALADTNIAAEFGAFRQKYGIGVSADEDDEEAIRIGINRLITVTNADAKLGDFAATDLKPYIDLIFAYAELMALAKGIPLHLLRMSGTIPSGESLKTAEAPLVARVTDTQTDFGDVLEDMLAFALQIAGTATDAQLTAVWQSPESRAEKDHIDGIAVKVDKIGVSWEMAMRELGYSEEEIATMRAEKQAKADALAAQLAAAPPAPVVAAPAGTGAAVAAPGQQGGQE